jgi:hypothetical protein
VSKHCPQLRDFITSLCYLSSYFIKSEKYTPHPNHPGVTSSDHGSDGPWKTTYVDAPVRLTMPTSLRSLGQQIRLVPLASPQCLTRCVRRAGSQAHRVSFSSFDFRPCSNITFSDFNTAKGQMGASTLLSFVNQGERRFIGTFIYHGRRL